MTAPFFQTSGNLLADRRYTFGQELAERGDAAGAADLFAQAVELAPAFVSAWFALGETRARLDEKSVAIDAFRKVLALDPADRHGAGLHLMRLQAKGLGGMPPDYVRSLFDQYAARFDTALVEGLAYRGPELLRVSVEAACAAAGRRASFRMALDLGCGTGLGGPAIKPLAGRLIGVDLSPKMVEQAKAKKLYDRLVVENLVTFLKLQSDAVFDLVFAADVFAYFADLAPLAVACARVLEPGGLLAFSVETHAGDGVILGEKLRFAHARTHVRAAIAAAGLRLLTLDDAVTRNDGNMPVPGLIAVAARD